MLAFAAEENLEAVAVAEVTEEKRLVLSWRGKEIVNIARKFLDTNGAHQETTAVVTMPKAEDNYFNYIYGSGDSTDWSGTDNYDGCTFLTEVPSLTPPTPEVPPTPAE
jgi:hypothetical protein